MLIQSIEELKTEFGLLVAEAYREQRSSTTYLARVRASSKVEALLQAAPYIEELALAEESNRLATITGPILKEVNRVIRQRPQRWEDIAAFIKEYRLDQDAYFFAFEEGLDLKERLFIRGVRNVYVTTIEGTDGNFYVFIVASLKRLKVGDEEIISPGITKATGKFSDYDEALYVAEYLTRYLYGWPMAPIEVEEPEPWLQEWKGG